MFEKILVAHDGSLKTEILVPAIRALAAREGVELTFLHVLTETDLEANDGDAEWLEENIRRRLRAMGREILGDEGTAEIVVTTGDPAERILGTAAERGSSLIAMATRGRGGPKRWLLGSVAEEVLRNSDRPVLIRNQPEAEDVFPDGPSGISKIALPLDGSERAAGVLPRATALARAFDAEVVVVHVSPVAPGGAVPPESAPEEPLVAEEVETLRESGVRIRTETDGGDPAHGIHRLLAKVGPDLVMMTTHGRSGFSRLLFGSVAEHVIRHGPWPVLLEREGTAGAAPKAAGG